LPILKIFVPQVGQVPVVALFVTRLICNELVRGESVERRRKVAEAEPVV